MPTGGKELSNFDVSSLVFSVCVGVHLKLTKHRKQILKLSWWLSFADDGLNEQEAAIYSWTK
jgi:hypothetical protein